MDLSTSILGTTTVAKLSASIATPILVIGSDTFTRAALAKEQCFNYVATSNLNRALSDMGIKNTRELFNSVAPSALAVPRLGTIALAVLGTAFAAKGIGGDHPLEAWVSRHSQNGAGIRTFTTIKKRVLADAREEKKAKKEAIKSRREKARAMKTKRFLDRAEPTT